MFIASTLKKKPLRC